MRIGEGAEHGVPAYRREARLRLNANVVLEQVKQRIAWWVALAALVVLCALSCINTFAWLNAWDDQIATLPAQSAALVQAAKSPHGPDEPEPASMEWCVSFLSARPARRGAVMMATSFSSLALFLGITLLRQERKHNHGLNPTVDPRGRGLANGES